MNFSNILMFPDTFFNSKFKDNQVIFFFFKLNSTWNISQV